MNSRSNQNESQGTSNVGGNYKHWIWVTADAKENTDPGPLYKHYRESNIYGLFFEFDHELHYREAKQNNLKAHRWIWTLNENDKEIIASHPEWYSVNRKGESCVERPPYVSYYHWLCPNHGEVVKHLENKVREILAKEYVDGIHLDYIRYCDVILPVNLWSKYGIRQTEELSEYDYCYCAICRKKFKALSGLDPSEIQFPDQNLSWRKFRYDSITNVVNALSAVASEYNKQITAAVFPTPDVAKRNVRQDWSNWNLDAVFPMIYHGFYKEDINWIGDAVKEGIRSLPKNIPLYAGLFLPDFKNIDELRKAIHITLNNGAAGISFFGDVSEAVLDVFQN